MDNKNIIEISKKLRNAIDERNFDDVKPLLEEGADPNLKNKYGMTSLHLAVYAGYLEIAQILIKYGANINCKCKEGNSPLHWAAFHGNLEMIYFLIREGANPNALTNANESPLHWGANGESPEVIKALLDAGTNPELLNNENETAEYIATLLEEDLIIRVFQEYPSLKQKEMLIKISMNEENTDDYDTSTQRNRYSNI